MPTPIQPSDLDALNAAFDQIAAAVAELPVRPAYWARGRGDVSVDLVQRLWEQYRDTPRLTALTLAADNGLSPVALRNAFIRQYGEVYSRVARSRHGRRKGPKRMERVNEIFADWDQQGKPKLESFAMGYGITRQRMQQLLSQHPNYVTRLERRWG